MLTATRLICIVVALGALALGIRFGQSHDTSRAIDPNRAERVPLEQKLGSTSAATKNSNKALMEADARLLKPITDLERTASELMWRQKYAEAKHVCLKAVEIGDKIGDRRVTAYSAMNMLGECYLEEGKNREALDLLVGAQSVRKGGNGRIAANLALAYARLGMSKEAVSNGLGQSLAKLAAQSVVYHENPLPNKTARDVEAQALVARAVVHYNRVLDEKDLYAANRLVPNQPFIEYMMGLNLRRGGDDRYDESCEWLRKAVKYARGPKLREELERHHLRRSEYL